MMMMTDSEHGCFRALISIREARGLPVLLVPAGQRAIVVLKQPQLAQARPQALVCGTIAAHRRPTRTDNRWIREHVE